MSEPRSARAALALAICGIAIALSCTIDRASDALACETTADCSPARMCDQGFCVLPPGNSNCDPDTRECIFDCTSPDPTNCAQIVCPPGHDCRIDCGPNACGNILCQGDARCTITCAGPSACGDVTCRTGACDVTCDGFAACGAIACASACRCDVDCANPDDCGDMTCRNGLTGVCARGGPGGACTSAGLGCDTCPL